MRFAKKIRWMAGLSTLAVGAGLSLVAGSSGADTPEGVTAATPVASPSSAAAHSVDVEAFAPDKGDNAGIDGKGFFVDLKLDFHGNLASTGFSGLQLTGPGVHNNAPPFPGSFSPGKDDRMPGLVVLLSTTNNARPGFHGPGTNLANLFNLTGVTNRSEGKTQLWDTWIVGDAIAGKDVDTTLLVAVVGDANHDGILNDAPSVVPDVNGDGVIDRADLEALGLASNIVEIPFHINGAPAGV